MVGGDDDVVLYGCGHLDRFCLEPDTIESIFLLHARLTRWICVDGRLTGSNLSL